MKQQFKGKESEQLTVKSLVALVLADIDINLLLNEEQTADNEKQNFTRGEIREQLEKTGNNILRVLKFVNINVDKPLFQLHEFYDELIKEDIPVNEYNEILPKE